MGIDVLIKEAADAIRANSVRDAFNLLNRAKSYKTPHINIDLLRAQCFLYMGQPVAAKQALLEELTYFPDNREAQNLLKEIEAQLKEDKQFVDVEFNRLLDLIWPYTMLSQERLYSLFCLGKKLCQANIRGNFVECGVARGGSAGLLSYVIKYYSRESRHLYAFDTFNGMPDPTDSDHSYGEKAEDTGWATGTCSAPEQSVLSLSERLGTADIVKPVKGDFHDTLPATGREIGEIALLHIDGDWYESTKVVLANLYELVVDQGVIQIDDFGHWMGCRKAVHEFETEQRLNFDVQPIDVTGVWFFKKS